MQQQEPNSNFMDFKTIIAIVLVGLVWIGWQNHLKNKYPDAFKNQETKEVTASHENTDSPQKTEKKAELNAEGNEVATVNAPNDQVSNNEPVAAESLTVHEDPSWKIEISSKGMGFKNIRLKTYTDRENQPIRIGDNSGYLPFETNIVGRNQPLHFDVQKVSNNEYLGKAQVYGLSINKKVVFNPENYTFKTEVTVVGNSDQFSGVVTYLTEKLEEHKSSFLLPAFNQQDVYVAHNSTSDREFLDPAQPFRGAYDQVGLFSLGSHYFASAVIDNSKVMPELKVAVDSQSSTGFGVLTHQVLNRTGDFSVSYTGFAGPKDVDVLKTVDTGMTEIIDFGWFSWLAVILFNILDWFYSIFGNYGVAIILLTLLVRALVLPFNMMSYKSMKMMQQIQPQIKALREKYKDDQQTLNREMMALMKNNKVNPMGGCLPMLLQFPIFIALYRVFGQTIDLYKAPFALWIHDLSLADPYYVLPVLMAVAFFFQTKLTPSTMDPTQQKVMMFMPIIFAVFMASLPSALTLYMLVSTGFGIVQQLYFMKEKKRP